MNTRRASMMGPALSVPLAMHRVRIARLVQEEVDRDFEDQATAHYRSGGGEMAEPFAVRRADGGLWIVTPHVTHSAIFSVSANEWSLREDNSGVVKKPKVEWPEGE